jgi:hypothetical protein
MEDVYSFIDAVHLLPSLLELDVIICTIFEQTIESVISIRDYTSQGFKGECQTLVKIYGHWLVLTGSTAGVVGQIIPQIRPTIEALSNNFIALKRSFDSGGTFQAALVPTRTLEEVVTLGL